MSLHCILSYIIRKDSKCKEPDGAGRKTHVSFKYKDKDFSPKIMNSVSQD